MIWKIGRKLVWKDEISETTVGNLYCVVPNIYDSQQLIRFLFFVKSLNTLFKDHNQGFFLTL